MKSIPQLDTNHIERFIEKIELVLHPTLGHCWIWKSTLQCKGYGQFGYKGHQYLSHRVAYSITKGTIPEGLELDHLCKVTNCVNPDHLEPVTHRVNILRGNSPSSQQAKRTHCPKGHALTEDNTRRYKNHRQCRTCHRDRQREYDRCARNVKPEKYRA